MYRLFIAINFTDQVKMRISSIVDRVKDANPDFKYEVQKKYHITLVFLGPVPKDKIDTIDDEMCQVSEAMNPFNIYFDKTGYFLRSGRLTFWLGIGKNRELSILQKDVEKGVQNITKINKRPFHPHITIARKNKFRGRQELEKTIEDVNHEIFHGPIEVNKIDLMESKLSRKGSVYKIVESYPFGTKLS